MMQATKEQAQLIIKENTPLGAGNHLLKLSPTAGQSLPPMQAGQFVQVAPPGGATMLRRPISVCNVEAGELWLLVARVGRGTVAITEAKIGDILNVIYPLGNSFSIKGVRRPLLVGGGVGIAPMLMLAKAFGEEGIKPDILLGGRSAGHIVLRECFEPLGHLHLTTDDGSLGVQGRVTDHPIMQGGDYDAVFACGPTPMMRAVALQAKTQGVPCSVSLEHTMACGIGACLCCVTETTTEGNVCVCTEGPVFDASELMW